MPKLKVVAVAVSCGLVVDVVVDEPKPGKLAKLLVAVAVVVLLLFSFPLLELVVLVVVVVVEVGVVLNVFVVELELPNLISPVLVDLFPKNPNVMAGVVDLFFSSSLDSAKEDDALLLLFSTLNEETPNLIGSLVFKVLVVGCAVKGLRPKLMLVFKGALLKLENEPAAATSEENFVLGVASFSCTKPSRLVMQHAHSSLLASFCTRHVEHVHLANVVAVVVLVMEVVLVVGVASVWSNESCFCILLLLLGLALEQHTHFGLRASF